VPARRESVKRCFSFFAVLFTGLVFSISCFAGNTTNAGSTGNVTGLILCEEKDADVPLPVDELTIAINADGCACEFNDCIYEELNCSDGEACSVCLANLKRYGMTITSATSFYGVDEEDEREFKFPHLVEGNAGPFIDRFGSCPCSFSCEP
jgi:hypothetical protein